MHTGGEDGGGGTKGDMKRQSSDEIGRAGQGKHHRRRPTFELTAYYSIEAEGRCGLTDQSKTVALRR